MTAETWKRVESHPDYEVSDLGRVRRDGRILKAWCNGSGYLQLGLSSHSVVTRFLVHRLVALTFHGDPPAPDMDVAHWNGVRSDNRSGNLRWATRAENMQDMVRHGTVNGENNYAAKLSEQDVLDIRELRAGGATYDALGALYNVKRQTVQDACNGRNWKHLPVTQPIPRRRSPSAFQPL